MADTIAGKAQVAREVCAASAAFASCTHRRRSPRRPPFVDWYLVLAIGEASSEDAVKRRYRHLALQLHPDKNRHPKAEVAFKLVSEAHACLTDKARRRAFDVERSTAFCAACHARLVTRHRASTDKKSTPSSAPSARQHQQAHSSVAKPLRRREREEADAGSSEGAEPATRRVPDHRRLPARQRRRRAAAPVLPALRPLRPAALPRLPARPATASVAIRWVPAVRGGARRRRPDLQRRYRMLVAGVPGQDSAGARRKNEASLVMCSKAPPI